jgi:hypothetical protein
VVAGFRLVRRTPPAWAAHGDPDELLAGAREAERHHGFEEVAGVLPADVAAARTAGWHGVLQVETERSIAEIETVIRRQAAG